MTDYFISNPVEIATEVFLYWCRPYGAALLGQLDKVEIHDWDVLMQDVDNMFI